MYIPKALGEADPLAKATWREDPEDYEALRGALARLVMDRRR
jgi:hypothetical protein